MLSFKSYIFVIHVHMYILLAMPVCLSVCVIVVISETIRTIVLKFHI